MRYFGAPLCAKLMTFMRTWLQCGRHAPAAGRTHRLRGYRPRAPRHDFLVLAPLWLMLLVSSVQQVMVAPVLPMVRDALRLGADAEPALGLIGTVFSVMLMVFALIAGAASDRIGRRKIMLVGSGALAVALLLHAWAMTLGWLLVFRGLAGAATGVLTGSYASYIGDYFPYEKRGAALGWVLSGFAAGWIVGIPLGTMLAVRMGFAAPFVAFGWVMLVAFGLVYWLLPQPRVARDVRPWSARTVAAKYGGLVVRRQTGVMVVCYFLMYGCAALFLFFLPMWLEEAIRLSSAEVAMLFSVAGLTLVVVSPLAGRLSDRIGRKVLIVCACVGTGVIVGSITFFVTGLIAALLFFSLAMVFESCRAAPMQALMSRMVSHEERGAFFSLCNAVGQCGFGVGAVLAGWLYAEAGYVSSTIAAACCIGLVAAAVWVWVDDPSNPSVSVPSVRCTTDDG